MKALCRFALAAATLPIAASAQTFPLTQTGAFTVPGTSASNPFRSFDQIYVDPLLQLGVLASRNSKAVTIFNAFTGQPIGATPPVFTGVGASVDVSGPDGAIIAGTQIWATDYPSTIRVFDLRRSLANPPQIGVINTGGSARADSLDYDPFNHTVIAANSDVRPNVPFFTLIDTRTLQIRKRVNFDGTNGTPDASIDGIGGVLYDYALNSFVVSATSVGSDETKGAVAVLNPDTGAVVRVIGGLDGCMPSTLAEGPGANVIVGCDPGFPAPDPVVFSPKTYIVNAATGTIAATIREVGGADFVAYNLRDNRYYTASRDFFTSAAQAAATPVLGIINAGTNQWIANIPSAPNAHSVAVNPLTNTVYVPLPNGSAYCGGLPGCIAAAVSH